MRSFRQTRGYGLLTLAISIALGSGGCANHSDGSIDEGTEILALDESGSPATMRVESVIRDPKDPDGDVYLYQLSVRYESTGTYQPYCQPDREGKTLAIPLQGVWDGQRNHVMNDSVTFACTNGSLAKCVRLGYKPWKTVNGVSLAAYHQACVHLVAADYCGDGRPHTREGTKIDMWDDLGIQKRETEPGMVFEAAWSPRGAEYLNKPRYAEPLSDLVTACPDRLRGRTSLDAPGLDDHAVSQRFPDVRIFTESFVRTDLP